MVLVDSSGWIRLAHGRVTLSELVGEEELAVCPIVVMEVLRGTADAKRYEDTREMFRFVELLDAPTPHQRFEEAAQLYMQCRDAGVTPSAVDCLVAACAIAHDIPLAHFDSDFEHIARATTLKTLTRS